MSMLNIKNLLPLKQLASLVSNVLLLQIILIIWPLCDAVGIQWDRFQLYTQLPVIQSYDDNIYLQKKNKNYDYITSFEPEIKLNMALMPRKLIKLEYQGRFLSYAEADNFKRNYNRGELSFIGTSKKDSRLEVGFTSEDTAYQPYSKIDRFKDYTLNGAFAKTAFIYNDITEFGASYHYAKREFDRNEFANDDYRKKTCDFYMLYNRSLIFPILLQYRFVDHNNENRTMEDKDFRSQTIFAGARWKTERRLSGTLRLGYEYATFNRFNSRNFKGIVIDTNLNYDLSEITKVNLMVRRSIDQATISARESGDYFILSEVGIGITHHRWEKITSLINLLYQWRDFKEIGTPGYIRQDEYFSGGLSMQYALCQWIALELDYNFRNNVSNASFNDYTDNLMTLKAVFSL